MYYFTNSIKIKSNSSIIILSLIISSFIIFTKGLPLYSTLNIDENKIYKNINDDNFKILNNNNNYKVNATIIQQLTKYNITTKYITGEVIFTYNNIYDNYNYCKIIINISKQIKDSIIHNYIYNSYYLGKEIKLFCNNKECIEKQYNQKYEVYEIFTCHILNKNKINDEL